MPTPGEETCAICTGTSYQSDGYDHDLRTLRLSYFYKLDEGTDRLRSVDWRGNEDKGMYEIRTCKDCRGEFIEMLWAWAKGKDLFKRSVMDTWPTDSERNIPVRRAGRTVLINREEWDAMRRARG